MPALGRVPVLALVSGAEPGLGLASGAEPGLGLASGEPVKGPALVAEPRLA